MKNNYESERIMKAEKDLCSGYRIKLSDVAYKPTKLIEQYVLDLRDSLLEIPPAQFVAIVGGNGAGKSSILRAIAGELRRGVTGQVCVASQPIERPVNQVIDGVGIVHQFDECDLIEHLTVAQNISIRQLLGGGHPSAVFSASSSWRREIAATLGSEADFSTEDINMLVSHLSGGKKQMLSVVIAMHLEHKRNPCRLLLLDEHTSRLDHTNSKEVMDYTVKQIRTHKMTALMVTHRYADAITHADRILVVSGGKIVRDLTKDNPDWSIANITRMVGE